MDVRPVLIRGLACRVIRRADGISLVVRVHPNLHGMLTAHAKGKMNELAAFTILGIHGASDLDETGEVSHDCMSLLVVQTRNSRTDPELTQGFFSVIQR